MSIASQPTRQDDAEHGGLARRQTVAVWIAWIAALALAVLGLVEASLGGLANAAFAAVAMLLVFSTVTVGAMLVTRLPRHAVGWFLLAGGLTLAVSLGTQALSDYGLNVHPGSVPGAVWLAVISGATGGLFVGLLAGFVPLYFPTGQLPSPRWRSVAIFAILPTVGPGIVSPFSPFSPGTYPPDVVNPLALGGSDGQLVELLNNVSSLLGVIAFFFVIASLIVRYRRAQGIERQQLKWFAAIGLVVIPTFVFAIVVSSGATSGSLLTVANVAWAIALGGLAFLPVAIGLAIVRYRLYEIDRLISRTISYGLLTVILGGLFVAAIVVAQVILAPLTGSNEVAVAGSTLLVFSLFGPLRRWVQRRVDRRFNRARYDIDRTMAAFAARLRNEVDLEQLRAEILTAVSATVEPTSGSLWLRH